MREIKFRTWNRKLKEMFYGNDVSIFTDKNGNLVAYVLSDGEKVYETIMQYTGIKDVNGKEIYEGDIIEYKDPSIGGYNDLIGDVVYSEAAWWIENDKKRCANPLFSETAYLTVLGNIYEDPELFKTTLNLPKEK